MNNKINSAPENQENPQEYFKSVLGKNSPDYLDLERMVTETSSKISWENLKKFTKIENGKVEGIYWKGDLDLTGTSITSLGKLKKVDGVLVLEGVSTLTDLGFLEEVGSYLDLRGTSITSLGKLKTVDGSLILYGVSTLTDLGFLEEVGSYLDLRGTNISSLGKLIKVNGDLDLDGVSTLTDLGELSEVGGYLDLRGTSINFQLDIFKKVIENKLSVGTNIYYDDYLITSKTIELLNCQIIYGCSIPFSFEHKESFKSLFGKEENRDEKLQNVCLGIAKDKINRYLESLEAKKQEYKEVPTIELKDEILKDYTEKKLFFEEMFGPRITGEIFSQFLKR